MKKNKNKGFLLTELLVTATLVSTVLIFLYAQFYSIKRSYDNSFNYNTVNDLYALDNVKSYLIDSGYISAYIDNNVLNGVYYKIIADYSLSEYDISSNYFKGLIRTTKINRLYFTKENLTSLKTYLSSNITSSNASLLEPLRKFVNYLDYNSNDDSGYRLIAEFIDGTFATLLVGGE